MQISSNLSLLPSQWHKFIFFRKQAVLSTHISTESKCLSSPIEAVESQKVDLKQKVVIKRGKRKSRKGINKSKQIKMTFIGANAAGLKNKKDSYLRLVKHFNPGAFFVQETKVRRKKCFEVDGYDSFEFIRTNSSGGGLLTLVHKSLDPVEVATESEQEILVVEASVANMRVRLINAYGPQEYASEDTWIQFFTQLDLEIKKAKLSGALVLIEMDSNAKLGSKLIPSDPQPQSENGKLLENVINDNSLVIVNAQPFCTGSITRYRKTIRGEEKSILDHFLVCEEMLGSVRSMSVDEAGCYALTKYSNKSGSRASVKESDHYTIFLELEHLWKPSESETGNRLEVYNFNDKESLTNLFLLQVTMKN